MKTKVYFSRTITPEKVLELYKLLNKNLPGKVAIKVHSGEKGNQNFLHPEFWRNVIDHVGHRNFRLNGIDISPEQWTILLSLWEKDGITQQDLCNATFKDKPSMTRLIDNMERQHLVVRISDKRDRRTNLIHLTKTGRELEGKAFVIANQTLKEALQDVSMEDLKIAQEVLRKIFMNTKD